MMNSDMSDSSFAQDVSHWGLRCSLTLSAASVWSGKSYMIANKNVIPVILRYFKVFWYFRDMADIAPCGGARAVVIRGKGAFAAVCECPCGKVPV